MLEGAPAPPPARPYGGRSARSERTISEVPGVRHRQTRSIARPPRCSPGPAGVGHEPVPLDDDRELRLRHLDGDVRGEAGGVREPVVPVPGRRAAPRPDDQLVVDVPVAAAGPVGAEDGERVAALARGRHPVGDQLRERAVERVDHAKAGDAAHRRGSGHHDLGDGARLRQHPHRPERAGRVRHLERQRAADDVVDARHHEGARAVERPPHHRRRLGQVGDHLVARRS